MKRIFEEVKEDIGLIPQSLGSTNATGRWYPMKNYRRVLAHLVCGAIASGGTAVIELDQATDAAGTSAKVITNATATITSNTKCSSVTVALTSTGAGDTVTVSNGITSVTFTQGSSVVASRTFADAAGLAACINSTGYGVLGLKATVSTTNVIITSSDPGEYTVTVSSTNVGGTITQASQDASAYVEVEASQLDQNNGFVYVAAKVTTTATVLCGVSLQRGTPRNLVAQQVGASAVV